MAWAFLVGPSEGRESDVSLFVFLRIRWESKNSRTRINSTHPPPQLLALDSENYRCNPIMAVLSQRDSQMEAPLTIGFLSPYDTRKTLKGGFHERADA